MWRPTKPGAASCTAICDRAINATAKARAACVHPSRMPAPLMSGPPSSIAGSGSVIGKQASLPCLKTIRVGIEEAANGVTVCNGALLLGIDFNKAHSRFEFVCHVMKDGGKLLARSAPAGPKIDHDRNIGVDKGIEVIRLPEARGLTEQGRLAMPTFGGVVYMGGGQAVSGKAVATIGSDK